MHVVWPPMVDSGNSRRPVSNSASVSDITATGSDGSLSSATRAAAAASVATASEVLSAATFSEAAFVAILAAAFSAATFFAEVFLAAAFSAAAFVSASAVAVLPFLAFSNSVLALWASACLLSCVACAAAPACLRSRKFSASFAGARTRGSSVARPARCRLASRRTANSEQQLLATSVTIIASRIVASRKHLTGGGPGAAALDGGAAGSGGGGTAARSGGGAAARGGDVESRGGDAESRRSSASMHAAPRSVRVNDLKLADTSSRSAA